MESRWLRSLVLAYSVAFIWPQCWCCVLTRQMPTFSSETVTTSVAPEKKVSCCACGKHDAQPSKDEPAKKPSDRPNQPCPCIERQILLPSMPPVEQVEANFASFATVSSTKELPPLSGVVEMVESSFSPGTPFLHVLHCVWLC